jgi:hypothetical protein
MGAAWPSHGRRSRQTSEGATRWSIEAHHVGSTDCFTKADSSPPPCLPAQMNGPGLETLSLVSRDWKSWPDSNGYIRIAHGPRASEFEHRRVMEAFLGTTLPGDTVVHHRNRRPWDNRLDNLLLLPDEALHRALHQAINDDDWKRVHEVEESCSAWAELIREHIQRAGAPGKLPPYSGTLLRRLRPELTSVPKNPGGKRRRFIVRPGSHRPTGHRGDE